MRRLAQDRDGRIMQRSVEPCCPKGARNLQLVDQTGMASVCCMSELTLCRAVRWPGLCTMELPRYQLSLVGTMGRFWPSGSCTASTMQCQCGTRYRIFSAGQPVGRHHVCKGQRSIKCR